jgi:hypothetical protein
MTAERWLKEMIAQLPPHVDAEFAESRMVALEEVAVVEAFRMIAKRTSILPGHHRIMCQCTTSRSSTSAATSGAFGVTVL